MLEAALPLLARQGFHGTAVPEIARAAGVGAGTLYRHFESKEGLVNALYRHAKGLLMAHLLEDFPWDATPRSQFRRFFWRLTSFARSHGDAFVFLEHHHHADYLDRESQRVEKNSLAPVHQFLEAGIERGLFRKLPPAALVAMTWGSVSMLIKAERLGHLCLDEATLAEVEAACWDAMRPPAVGQEG